MGGARDRIVLLPVAISGEGAERLDGTVLLKGLVFALDLSKWEVPRKLPIWYHLVCFEKLFVNDSLQGRGEH